MATTIKRGSLWNTSAGAKTVAAFTPISGDLLIAITGHTNTDTADAVTDSESGTWTNVGTFRSHSTSVAGGLRMWARDTGVSGSSMTVTTTPGGTSTGGGLAVLSISGASGYGATAIRHQAGQADTAAGTPSVTLPLAADTANTLIGAVMTNSNATANTAVPTGWAAEDYDQGYNNPATGLEVSHIDTGETRTTIPWTQATPSQFASLMIEVITAAGTADLTVTLYQGAVAKASKVITGITASSFTDDSFELTGTEADSITDYNDLRLGFKASGTGGARVDVSWAELEVPGAPPNALVPLSPIQTTSSFGSPTVRAGAVATPTLSASTSFGSPTIVTTGTATPSTIAGTTSFPTATKLAAAVATAADYNDTYSDGYDPLPARVTIPTPTVVATGGGGGNITATPATVAGTSSLAAPTVQAQGKPTPAVVDATTTLADPTLRSDRATTPSTVAGSTSLAVPTVRGAAVVTPTRIAAVASVPTPSVSVGGAANVAAVTIQGASSLATPTVRGTALVAPASLAATASLPAPTVVAGGAAVVSPATIQASTTLGATTEAAARPTPAGISATASFGTVLIGGAAQPTPGTIAAVLTMAAPTIQVAGSIYATPATIQITTFFGDPLVVVPLTITREGPKPGGAAAGGVGVQERRGALAGGAPSGSTLVGSRKGP